MKISLCMIVKDEEATLKRCLDSAKELADEIVIADTGSEDATKEIARAYTPLVYDFAWRDDFSAARNFSLGKATGDYLLWLDADDVLCPAEGDFSALREMLARDLPDMVRCPYDVAFDGAGNAVYSYLRERLFRREAGFRFAGRVHECVVPCGKICSFPLHVRHLGSEKERGARNLDIYRRQIAEEGALSPRDLFYYGRELYYHRLYAEAVAVLGEFLDGDGWYVNKIEACKIFSRCRLAQGDGEGSLAALFRSFLYGPPRASVCCEAGARFKAQKKYAEAAFWYESAMRCVSHVEEGDFDEPLCRTLTPLLELTCCYFALGDEAGALRAHRRAEELAPDHPSVRFNRSFFRGRGAL